ncbi:putative capsular polysaccharide biosynthesis protein [Candidatus Promineifilum breve]|uniref:Capsular polysaccharide biosynthesis protein n=1 Tax=Candidatus Promineifilum breve TaxID=1806508 RepID=A0A160T8A9_9CHLR|nr:Wzz/FepE/Etk N-terminal domain-containing protein [Candidatus Promineifilum breve]CUS05949.1 putative capsular polysaccharide biosynthesis protein [Candidatus Promineifilum breve]
MELSDYFRILRQRGWLVLLLMALTAAAAFGFSKIQTPVYESTLRLLVKPSRTDYGQAQAAKELLSGYQQWLYSSYRAQGIIDALQLDMTAGELLGNMRVASDGGSYVITLAVENTDPNLANDIARTWGDIFRQQQNEDNDRLRLEDRIFIEFIDDPQVGLERPRTMINTAAGAVFGLLLGVALIFLLEWLASGVMRRGEDVERYLGIPVIGAIPQE